MIENIGPNVARLRKMKGLTQQQLADKIGTKKQTISNLERGASYPKMSTLDLIANFFQATPTQLFGTPEEIKLHDTPAVMAQIDKYKNAVDRLLIARNFMADKSISDIDRMVENIDKIRTFFHKENAHIIDDKGHDMGLEIDENGKTVMIPSEAEQMEKVLDKLTRQVTEVHSAKNRYQINADGNIAHSR